MKLFNKILYHGTPHAFDKFDTEHIGTGEGEMRHGWGLYLAEDKDVVLRYYTNKYSNQILTIEIPDDLNFVEEDKPINQSENCRKAFEEFFKRQYKESTGKEIPKDNLEFFLGQYVQTAVFTVFDEYKKELSLTLSLYGFDGIHYDGLRDNSCYVIFNPEKLKIIEREEYNDN